MAIQLLYRLTKDPVKETGLKRLYMESPSVWSTQGRYFTATELVQLLAKIYKALPGTETFPPDWKIVEYQLSETRQSDINHFLKHKSSKPIIKGI